MDWIYDGNEYWEGGFRQILVEAQKTIKDNVAAIYQGIDAMNEGWSGAEYEEFKEKAYSYKKYLDALESIYGVYASLLDYQVCIKISNEMQKALREASELLGE